MFTQLLKQIPYLNLIIQLSKKHNVNIWLVGGFLRDLILEKIGALSQKKFDFDFCVEGEVLSVVKEFAKLISSKVIVLDEKEFSFRVVAKKKKLTYTYDFAKIRANTFKEDLSLRDFSINTLAINLQDKDFSLIDYFGAQEDIKKRLLKVIKERVLKDDPLRILRGFSFMANYGFRITEETKLAMIKYKTLLKKVSAERISEELFKILISDNSHPAIKLMSDLKIIDQIIPYIKNMRGVWQGRYHHLDVWEHSLETLKEFERLYKNKFSKNQFLFGYLNEELGLDKRRLLVIKLACILHDIGKPKAKRQKGKKTIFYVHEKIGKDLVEKIADRLRFSSKIKEVLTKLVLWHLRPGYLADQINPTKRAIYRFFRDTQSEGVGVILLSLADWRATKGPLTDTKKRTKHERIMLKIVNNYFLEAQIKPLKKIVDGYDIMRKFNLIPSPLIGKILNKIKEEQVLGKITNKKEAYNIAKKIILKFRRDNYANRRN
ncbi:MAG: HD domain-containing protein [Candidatus Omnitrophica bacterium]|nr:HD domain-containing protein [Candidatus Omnitrophota bacterium]